MIRAGKIKQYTNVIDKPSAKANKRSACVPLRYCSLSFAFRLSGLFFWTGFGLCGQVERVGFWLSVNVASLSCFFFFFGRLGFCSGFLYCVWIVWTIFLDSFWTVWTGRKGWILAWC